MTAPPRLSTEAALVAHTLRLEAAFWRTLAGPEKALEAELALIWARWAARAVDAANHGRDPVEELDEIGPAWAVGPLRARSLAVMTSAAELVRGLADVLKDAAAFTAERVRYAETMSLTRARGFQEAQKKIIRRVLADAAEPGRNPRAAAKDIQTALGGAVGKIRARTIARTELHAAAGYAQHQEAERAAQTYGIAFRKEWRATHDARVRKSHAAANGQRVAIAASYIVGGAALRFPGDPLGPGREVINCRCVSIFIPERLANRVPQAKPIGDVEPDLAPTPTRPEPNAPETTPQVAPTRWTGVDMNADQTSAANRKATRKGLEKLSGGLVAPQRLAAEKGRAALMQAERADLAGRASVTLDEGLGVSLYGREALRGKAPTGKATRPLVMSVDRALNTTSEIRSINGRIEISSRALEKTKYSPGDAITPETLAELDQPFAVTRTVRTRPGENVFLKIRNAGAGVELDVATPGGKPLLIPGSRLVVVSDDVFSGTRIIEVDAVPLRAWDHESVTSLRALEPDPDELLPIGTDVRRAHAAARRYVQTNGKKTATEYMAVVDETTGRVLVTTWGEKASTGYPFDLDLKRLNKPGERLAVHHNHPSIGDADSPLSSADLGQGSLLGVSRIYAHATKGSSFQAEVLVRDGVELVRIADSARKIAYSRFNRELGKIDLSGPRGSRNLTNIVTEALNRGLERAGLIKRIDRIDKETRAYFKVHEDLIERIATIAENMGKTSKMERKAAPGRRVPPIIIDDFTTETEREEIRARLTEWLSGDDLRDALAALDAYPIFGGNNA